MFRKKGGTPYKASDKRARHSSDRLKNPRAALTPPGGDLIAVIVNISKRQFNSNGMYDAQSPVHYDHCGQDP
jgi:hypothetical protein